MKKIAIHARHRNQYLRRQFQLDLFAWRQTSPCNASRGALHLAQRFGLPVDVADTIARLNGIGGSHHEA
jgi:hypothetical protein